MSRAWTSNRRLGAIAHRFACGRAESCCNRQFTGERLVFVRMAHVVDHDERGLRLWIRHGGPMAVTLTQEGLGLRDMAFGEWIARSTILTPLTWRGPDIFMFIPTGEAHSVWWFWDGRGQFVGWYVNLEEPGVCWDDGPAAGIDITDQDLDVWVYPDRSWEWKDEDELVERLAFPDHYWVADEAAVRAEGERMIALAEAARFPFDGTWIDFRPDPKWTVPTQLPPGWATTPRALRLIGRRGDSAGHLAEGEAGAVRSRCWVASDDDLVAVLEERTGAGADSDGVPAAPGQFEQGPVLLPGRAADRTGPEQVAGSQRRPVDRQVRELVRGIPVHGGEGWARDDRAVEADREVEGPAPRKSRSASARYGEQRLVPGRGFDPGAASASSGSTQALIEVANDLP